MNITDGMQWLALSLLALAGLFRWTSENDRCERLDWRISDERDRCDSMVGSERIQRQFLDWSVEALARALGWKYVPEGKTLGKWVKDEDAADTGPKRGRK